MQICTATPSLLGIRRNNVKASHAPSRATHRTHQFEHFNRPIRRWHTFITQHATAITTESLTDQLKTPSYTSPNQRSTRTCCTSHSSCCSSRTSKTTSDNHPKFSQHPNHRTSSRDCTNNCTNHYVGRTHQQTC
jgi:hypothetical protein